MSNHRKDFRAVILTTKGITRSRRMNDMDAYLAMSDFTAASGGSSKEPEAGAPVVLVFTDDGPVWINVRAHGIEWYVDRDPENPDAEDERPVTGHVPDIHAARECLTQALSSRDPDDREQAVRAASQYIHLQPKD